MRLLQKKTCCRPCLARVLLRLQDDDSEAGVFIQLDPWDSRADDRPPPFLILVASDRALVLLRGGNSLETVAAVAGLAARQASLLVLSIDRGGRLRVHIGRGPPVLCECLAKHSEDVTLWLMELHGKSSFGPLVVEDAVSPGRLYFGESLPFPEKTIVEHQQGVPSNITSPSWPTAPEMEGLLSPLPSVRSDHSPPESSRSLCLTMDDALSTPPSPKLDMTTMSAPTTELGKGEMDPEPMCGPHTSNPESLVGWRIHVQSLGEGLVVGVRRRLFFSTEHLVMWSNPPAQATKHCRKSGASAVVLRWDQSQKHRRHGLPFGVLSKEF